MFYLHLCWKLSLPSFLSSGEHCYGLLDLYWCFPITYIHLYSAWILMSQSWSVEVCLNQSFGTAPKGCHCFPCSLSQQSSLVSSCTFPIIKCKQEFSKELWFILLSSDIYKPRSKTKGIGCNWNVTVAKLFQWLKLRGNMHVF